MRIACVQETPEGVKEREYTHIQVRPKTMQERGRIQLQSVEESQVYLQQQSQLAAQEQFR